jgi:glycosyltransferase involved in cell wall biosynthesis
VQGKLVPEPVPILFTIPNFITAGSGRAMLNIIQRLDKNRLAVSVCVLRKGGYLDREVESMGIPLLEAPFVIPARPYESLLWRARQAAGLFQGGRYRLWHSFHYADDYTEAIIARMAGARAWIYTKKNMNWGRRSWYLRTLLATRVLAQNSDMLRDFFASPLFFHKARPVPRGVDTNRFHPEVAPRLDFRRHLNISPEAVVAGVVAHLVPVKGHPTLLAAVAKIPNLHVLIAGKPLDQEYTASLEKLVHSLGIQARTHFLGSVQDIPGLLAEMDIFVLPTVNKGEGCPVALLEAMSSGRACVATDIPGARDLIVPQRSGLIVPPENVDALAAALSRLVSSVELRRVLGIAARERVIQYYTIEKEVAAHQAIYEELLKNSDKRLSWRA